MTEDSSYELTCNVAEVVLGGWVEERVAITLKQREVSVHAGTWVVGKGFWHECRVDTLLDSNLFDNRSKGHDVVRHRKRIGVSKINFVLSRTTLVVAELDRDSKLLEHRHSATTEVMRGSTWNIVKVACGINWNR